MSKEENKKKEISAAPAAPAAPATIDNTKCDNMEAFLRLTLHYEPSFDYVAIRNQAIADRIERAAQKEKLLDKLRGKSK